MTWEDLPETVWEQIIRYNHSQSIAHTKTFRLVHSRLGRVASRVLFHTISLVRFDVTGLQDVIGRKAAKTNEPWIRSPSLARNIAEYTRVVVTSSIVPPYIARAILLTAGRGVTDIMWTMHSAPVDQPQFLGPLDTLSMGELDRDSGTFGQANLHVLLLLSPYSTMYGLTKTLSRSLPPQRIHSLFLYAATDYHLRYADALQSFLDEQSASLRVFHYLLGQCRRLPFHRASFWRDYDRSFGLARRNEAIAFGDDRPSGAVVMVPELQDHVSYPTCLVNTWIRWVPRRTAKHRSMRWQTLKFAYFKLSEYMEQYSSRVDVENFLYLAQFHYCESVRLFGPIPERPGILRQQNIVLQDYLSQSPFAWFLHCFTRTGELSVYHWYRYLVWRRAIYHPKLLSQMATHRYGYDLPPRPTTPNAFPPALADACLHVVLRSAYCYFRAVYQRPQPGPLVSRKERHFVRCLLHHTNDVALASYWYHVWQHREARANAKKSTGEEESRLSAVHREARWKKALREHARELSQIRRVRSSVSLHYLHLQATMAHSLGRIARQVWSFKHVKQLTLDNVFMPKFSTFLRLKDLVKLETFRYRSNNYITMRDRGQSEASILHFLENRAQCVRHLDINAFLSCALVAKLPPNTLDHLETLSICCCAEYRGPGHTSSYLRPETSAGEEPTVSTGFLSSSRFSLSPVPDVRDQDVLDDPEPWLAPVTALTANTTLRFVRQYLGLLEARTRAAPAAQQTYRRAARTLQEHFPSLGHTKDPKLQAKFASYTGCPRLGNVPTTMASFDHQGSDEGPDHQVDEEWEEWEYDSEDDDSFFQKLPMQLRYHQNTLRKITLDFPASEVAKSLALLVHIPTVQELHLHIHCPYSFSLTASHVDALLPETLRFAALNQGKTTPDGTPLDEALAYLPPPADTEETLPATQTLYSRLDKILPYLDEHRWFSRPWDHPQHPSSLRRFPVDRLRCFHEPTYWTEEHGGGSDFSYPSELVCRACATFFWLRCIVYLRRCHGLDPLPLVSLRYATSFGCPDDPEMRERDTPEEFTTTVALSDTVILPGWATSTHFEEKDTLPPLFQATARWAGETYQMDLAFFMMYFWKLDNHYSVPGCDNPAVNDFWASEDLY